MLSVIQYTMESLQRLLHIVTVLPMPFFVRRPVKEFRQFCCPVNHITGISLKEVYAPCNT